MKFNLEKLRKTAKPLSAEDRKSLEELEENFEWLAHSAKIALEIRKMLRTRGLSQSQFAVLVGVSDAQISKILSGKENLSLKTISRLEKALEAPLISTPVVKKSTVEIKTVSHFAYLPIQNHSFKGAQSNCFYNNEIFLPAVGQAVC